VHRLHPRPRRHATGAQALKLVLAMAWMATGPLTGRAGEPAHAASGHAHTVVIEGMRFNPQLLIVRRGDRITWINKDPFPHTVTATDGKFDSHPIAPEGSWTYLARKTGEYDYGCTLHVTMKGKIEVR
jgi:plastocyanin